MQRLRRARSAQRMPGRPAFDAHEGLVLGLVQRNAEQTTRQHHPVATAEGEPFARESMNRLIDLARDGISELMKVQNQVLK